MARLSRDDLERLLDLVEGARLSDAPAGSAAAESLPPPSSAALAIGPADETLTGRFASYFDRGLAMAGPHAGMARVLDHSQTYGAGQAVSDLLRRWESTGAGDATKTAYLLTGSADATGAPTLPTLEVVRQNFLLMSGRELTADDLRDFNGSGQPLIRNIAPVFNAAGEIDVDALSEFLVAGDGLTPPGAVTIDTVWLRNHNYWVDRLKQDTAFAWSEQDYFEAARIINTAEYQRVVFTEFAEAMGLASTGGVPVALADDLVDTGADQLSFAEVFSFTDGTGNKRLLSLADAFADTADAPAQASASDKPDHAPMAPQPGLVPAAGALAVLDAGGRGRADAGTSLNQVRAELFVLTGLASLRPYESWADFQLRNQLADETVADLKAAYPAGVDSVDLEVGGLVESGQQASIGTRLAGLIAQQAPGSAQADAPMALDRIEHLSLRAMLEQQSFSTIVVRTTGLSGLPEQLLVPADETVVARLSDGDDIYIGHSGGDIVYGGDGDDVILGSSDVADATEVGEDGVPALDVLLAAVGVPLAASRAAASGGQAPAAAASSDAACRDNDVLHGDAGDDIVLGGAGDDAIYGGSGDDLLAGGRGHDMLAGGAGEDLLSGGSGNDLLVGGEGRDAIYGGSGEDALAGGEGADVLSGGTGSDYIEGNAGRDELAGGEGDDTLYGDYWEPAIEPSAAAVPTPATPAVGTVAVDAAALPAAAVAADALAGNADVASADAVHGTAGADDMTGSRGADVLAGGGGYDTIDGGDGSDIVDGGSGADRLYGGRGNDELIGGSGADQLFGGIGNDLLLGGSGNDLLDGGSGSDVIDGGSGNDWIYSLSGSDTIILQPGFGNDVVVGFDGDSTGTGGQLRIDVSAYGMDADSFGIDILVLAVGEDTIISIGSDTLTLLSVNADVIDRNDFIFS